MGELLTPRAGEAVLQGQGAPIALPVGLFWGCCTVLTTWPQDSPRVGDPRERWRQLLSLVTQLGGHMASFHHILSLELNDQVWLTVRQEGIRLTF